MYRTTTQCNSCAVWDKQKSHGTLRILTALKPRAYKATAVGFNHSGIYTRAKGSSQSIELRTRKQLGAAQMLTLLSRPILCAAFSLLVWMQASRWWPQPILCVSWNYRNSPYIWWAKQNNHNGTLVAIAGGTYASAHAVIARLQYH